MKFYLTLFLLLIFLAIAFIFGSQNNQLITLNYIIARADITVAQAVSLFTLIGFSLGMLTAILWKLLRVMRINKKRSSS